MLFLGVNINVMDEKNKEYIKELIFNKKINKAISIIKNNPEILDWFIKITKFVNGSISERLYCWFHNLTEIPKSHCNEKPMVYEKFSYGYKNVCKCNVCRTTISEKRRKTNTERYGSISPFGNKTIQNKSKKTLLQKYGVNNVSKLDLVQNKRTKTNLQKYQTNVPIKNKIIKSKQENTILKKYGVRNISSLEIIKNKKANTCLKNYGVTNPSKSKKIQEKKKLNRSLKNKLKVSNRKVVADTFQSEYTIPAKLKKKHFTCISCHRVFSSQTNLPNCPICSKT